MRHLRLTLLAAALLGSTGLAQAEPNIIEIFSFGTQGSSPSDQPDDAEDGDNGQSASAPGDIATDGKRGLDGLTGLQGGNGGEGEDLGTVSADQPTQSVLIVVVGGYGGVGGDGGDGGNGGDGGSAAQGTGQPGGNGGDGGNAGRGGRGGTGGKGGTVHLAVTADIEQDVRVIAAGGFGGGGGNSGQGGHGGDGGNSFDTMDAGAGGNGGSGYFGGRGGKGGINALGCEEEPCGGAGGTGGDAYSKGGAGNGGEGYPNGANGQPIGYDPNGGEQGDSGPGGRIIIDVAARIGTDLEASAGDGSVYISLEKGAELGGTILTNEESDSTLSFGFDVNNRRDYRRAVSFLNDNTNAIGGELLIDGRRYKWAGFDNLVDKLKYTGAGSVDVRVDKQSGEILVVARGPVFTCRPRVASAVVKDGVITVGARTREQGAFLVGRFAGERFVSANPLGFTAAMVDAAPVIEVRDGSGALISTCKS